MSIKSNLMAARHHLVFIIGLCAAFGIVIYLESFRVSPTNFSVEVDENIPYPDKRPLTAEELEWGRIAWRYFENNYQAENGFVNSVDKFEASTIWDTASYLLGLISAYKLEIIDEKTFESRIDKILDSLKSIPLFEDKLPNKSYNTRTLKMVNYSNQVSEKGIGWSAIDIGRVMVPFNVLVWYFPEHTHKVNEVLQAWSMSSVVKDGSMYGAAIDKEEVIFLQEGRIGYEEYAAKAFVLAGFDVSKALEYADHLIYKDIYGVRIPTDNRKPEVYHAHNYVVSESYILDLIEFGGDRISKEFAHRVYKVQEKRYEDLNVFTAVSEDNIDQAPYFVYNTVYTSGKSWNAITDSGEDASEFRSTSTKAAIGWHMVYETEYTEKLVEFIKGNYDEERGWYSGIYEKSLEPNKAITANTNAIILESLHYKVFGPMLQIGG